MLASSLILKTCWAYGISTSFNDVSEPHMKNSVVMTARAPKYELDALSGATLVVVLGLAIAMSSLSTLREGLECVNAVIIHRRTAVLADFLPAESRSNGLQNRSSSLTNPDHYLTLPRFPKVCFRQAVLWIRFSSSRSWHLSSLSVTRCFRPRT